MPLDFDRPWYALPGGWYNGSTQPGSICRPPCASGRLKARRSRGGRGVTRSAELGELASSEWRRLQDAVARLEQAWRQADDVNLAQFLPPTPPSLRLLFLYELVKTDLQERCNRQRFVPLE